MRDAISPSQRLSITLRYLATGNTFEDLKFTWRWKAPYLHNQ
nr:unnamed protein product [Callosobruchus analis]